MFYTRHSTEESFEKRRLETFIMAERCSRPPSILLEPPPKGVELDDPGAQPSSCESEDEHFSDASEGIATHLRSQTPSPIPRTRVEKIDDSPSYGEVPGSPAYEKRVLDAVPDEIEIIGSRPPSRPQSSASIRAALPPNLAPAPRTVVEKIDPTSPSYGEEPGTLAYESHKADSAPDVILKIQEQTPQTCITSQNRRRDSGSEGSPVPETVLSRVESPPENNSRRLFNAHRRRPSDALPDVIQTIPDVPDDDQAFGDDFYDFEEGEGNIEEDDFGDFGEAEFPQPMEITNESTAQINGVPMQQPPSPSLPPLLDFESIKTLPDLLAATSSHLDAILPGSANLPSLPPISPIPDSSAIFITERSLSLWSQLVSPPPLQPANWTKSRIRRVFLVSLGVPVDLDEILPASKQKKLVLPSINLEGNSSSSSNIAAGGLSPTSNAKNDYQGHSSTLLDSARSTSRSRPPRRRGLEPPPELDLSAVRRLCATTDAALDNFTDDELRQHIAQLERIAVRASEVLEYWLKRRDAQIGEKEAFEGVIENLVKHARQVRK
ncbi:conserved hypothetical protein [Histoplasma capsulatum G186AR]|uniref:Uncharacterized protein n=1 Tax=Ajellomyces capsulatus (strain G186AR / H82 / ATCC MYA-2454 / RMSCC 2432) TaxID=447093 RepID=C0NBF8_AJECG|nr:uncharacterized protein HCBG_00454 [Histoplasma capsulatum G186AR]EEH10999.1 conserved hypothetical protein [Histoplasma capsulatum G186AR]